MNIEVANRLVNLRKEKGLSQEALAEKLGISRQAVSKWERGEASPDTDNLITLAKLYEISLDELLNLKTAPTDTASAEESSIIRNMEEPAGMSESECKTDTEEPAGMSESECKTDTEEPAGMSESECKTDTEEPVSMSESRGVTDMKEPVSMDQVAMEESAGEIEADQKEEKWDGIRLEDKDGSTIRFDTNGVFIYEQDEKKQNKEEQNRYERFNESRYDREENEEARRRMFKSLYLIPFPVIIVFLFLLLGGLLDLWHPAWLLFLLIPLWYTTIAALEKRNANIFCFPVLVVILYLVAGFIADAWHPGWLIFLTIPIYYPFVNFVRGMRGED